MRRFLTTLVILLVVLAAGMTALVVLINPNDFRSYMTQQVQQRTGYQLTLDGDLRWHVWPQLSILAGRMSLTAPGAQAPVISADNMRLDVRLWPLFSHQLSVKQVMLKGAVIRLTPGSDPVQRQQGTPEAPGDVQEPVADVPWKLNINKVRVQDSLLIWQRGPDDQINMRDINLSVDQDEKRQATLEFSSRINRNQRDLAFSLSGTADLSDSPRVYRATVTNFDYQLTGAGVPGNGVKGQGSLALELQSQNQQIDLTQLQFSANESQLTGQLRAVLGEAVPQFSADLKSPVLNLDSLNGWQPGQGKAAAQHTPSVPMPVTSQPVAEAPPDDMAYLRDFIASLHLQADKVIYHGLEVSGVALEADNQRGKARISTLNGKVSGGTFALTGDIDATGPGAAKIRITPRVEHVAVAPVMRALEAPQILEGILSLSGNFNGSGLGGSDFTRHWSGSAHVAMNDMKVHGLNIQQLIQQAVERSQKDVHGADNYDTYTRIRTLKADTVLKNGALKITQLYGDSDLLTVGGTGNADLNRQTCDMNLRVRVLQGWNGKTEVVKALQQSVIPLRVYGPWDNLNYTLRVDDILKDQLQQRAKDAINNWLNKQPEDKGKKKLEQLLNRL